MHTKVLRGARTAEYRRVKILQECAQSEFTCFLQWICFKQTFPLCYFSLFFLQRNPELALFWRAAAYPGLNKCFALREHRRVRIQRRSLNQPIKAKPTSLRVMQAMPTTPKTTLFQSPKGLNDSTKIYTVQFLYRFSSKRKKKKTDRERMLWHRWWQTFDSNRVSIAEKTGEISTKHNYECSVFPWSDVMW